MSTRSKLEAQLVIDVKIIDVVSAGSGAGGAESSCIYAQLWTHTHQRGGTLRLVATLANHRLHFVCVNCTSPSALW